MRDHWKIQNDSDHIYICLKTEIKISSPKMSPFEIANYFDQKFRDFIVTNFHGEQKIKDMINVKCFFL